MKKTPKKRRFALSSLVLALVALVLGCTSALPPTEILIEVTREVTREVTVIVNPMSENGRQILSRAATEQALQGTNQPTPLPPTPTPSTQATIAANTQAQAPATPTPLASEVYVAQQTFQNGAMFWLQPIDQIWVISTVNGENVWQIYEDTFEEGEPERDPDLEPPVSGLYQPVRGFGKLWRESDVIRNQLGWGVSEEVGYLTNYEYHYQGRIENDTFVQGPGYHEIRTLSDLLVRFNEGIWTWEVFELEENE